MNMLRLDGKARVLMTDLSDNESNMVMKYLNKLMETNQSIKTLKFERIEPAQKEEQQDL